MSRAHLPTRFLSLPARDACDRCPWQRWPWRGRPPPPPPLTAEAAAPPPPPPHHGSELRRNPSSPATRRGAAGQWDRSGGDPWGTLHTRGGSFLLSANQFYRRKDYRPPPDEYAFTGFDEKPAHRRRPLPRGQRHRLAVRGRPRRTKVHGEGFLMADLGDNIFKPLERFKLQMGALHRRSFRLWPPLVHG